MYHVVREESCSSVLCNDSQLRVSVSTTVNPVMDVACRVGDRVSDDLLKSA